MITEKEWQKLKVGDVVWHASQDTVEPIKLIISKITKCRFYCNNRSFDKKHYIFYTRLSDAIRVVNFRLKIQIEKIQAQIKSNLNMKE
ncbi:hypothetical protein [Gilliamella apicola]|uniref:hypothetical protein n=1 Tax=Gilliamella apicola TaxID=1196095 RepID=UPI003987990E